MKTKLHRLGIAASVISLSYLGIFSLPARAQGSAMKSAAGSSELISQLSKGLSVTHSQAKGGAGTLFALAKSRLSADEFSKVSSAVPGMSGLLKAAPALSQNSEFSGLEGALPGNMGHMAEAAEAFHKLGMSPEMMGKFVPIMSKFVQVKGGSSTASLLEKALK